jgi:acyl-ACP thioesterase
VRSTRIEVSRFPRLDERLELSTWCSGLGRLWAERRTSIAGALEAAALWVYVDPASGRPRRFDERQLGTWEPSTGGRRVRARLQHPDPPEGAPRRPWTFRRADLDVARHVNNAAYWEVLEELVAEPGEPVAVEIEHRAAALAGPAEIAVGEGMWWVVAPGGEVHASLTLGA